MVGVLGAGKAVFASPRVGSKAGNFGLLGQFRLGLEIAFGWF